MKKRKRDFLDADAETMDSSFHDLAGKLAHRLPRMPRPENGRKVAKIKTAFTAAARALHTSPLTQTQAEMIEKATQIHLANLHALDGLGEAVAEGLRLAVLAETSEENRRVWGASRESYRRFAAMAEAMLQLSRTKGGPQ